MFCKFIRFLKEKKVYRLYRNNISENKLKMFIESDFDDYIHFISGAFSWSFSNEGKWFWWRINDIWLTELKKLT